MAINALFDHPREERRFKETGQAAGILWRVYPPDVTVADIEQDFQELEGHRVYSDYDCTGQPFSYPARIRRTSTRCLVTQFVGLDI